MNAHFHIATKATPSSRRILSLWFPHLSTDRLCAGDWAARGLRRAPLFRRCWSAVVTATHNRSPRSTSGLRPRTDARHWRCRRPRHASRRSRSSRRNPKPIKACSKASPTGVTAIRRWWRSMVTRDCFSISPAAAIYSAARRACSTICWPLFHQGFDARAGIASTARRGLGGRARFHGNRHRAPMVRKPTLAPLPLTALRLTRDLHEPRKRRPAYAGRDLQRRARR